MRYCTLFILLFFSILQTKAQKNLSQSGYLDLATMHSTELNDIWGYEDTSGNEYALVGLQTGVSVVDVEDPTNPQEVFWQGGVQSTWRDIKTWNNHAYVTNEEDNGLMIIDLSPLPSSTNLNVSYYTGGGSWNAAHNLYIDENGIAYIFGTDRGNGGAIMLDLTQDPMNPVEIGIFDDWYIHDGMVRGDTLYAGHINEGFFSIVDVSDKSNPQVLGTKTTPYSFAHNLWVSDDGDHVYTTDEKSGAFIAAYDITDPTNIQETDRTRSNPGSGVIPHNTHFKNEYLITSYYRDGVLIHDVSRPGNMVEVGYFDTADTLSGDGFNGCWGVYPWLPSGNLILSDIEEGLFVLAPNYQRGCYLEGAVTDQNTGNPLNDVEVTILQTGEQEFSKLTGDYAHGTVDSGSYAIIFDKATHIADTVFNVTLDNDSVTILDMQLEERPNFAFDGEALRNSDSTGLANVEVVIEGDELDYQTQTNGSGNFSISTMYSGDYDIRIGKWGFGEICDSSFIDSTTAAPTYYLEKGIADDFSLDLGWTVNTSSAQGSWERGEPNGTEFNSVLLNPDTDRAGDCFGEAYITGNQGATVNDDDVNGRVALTSPTFDGTTFSSIMVKYHPWFITLGFAGIGDDTLFVKVDNGSSEMTLDSIMGYSGNWNPDSARIPSDFPLTNTMQVIFEVEDKGGSHVVEAGVDGFSLFEAKPSSVEEQDENKRNQLTLYPNPSTGSTLQMKYDLNERPGKMVIYDLTGRKVMESNKLVKRAATTAVNINLEKGYYLVRIFSDKGQVLAGDGMVVE